MTTAGNIFEQALAQAMTPLEMEPGDYKRDGLIYCGKCNTPRQREIDFLDEKRIVTITCQCREKEAERKREAERFQQRKDYIADTITYLVSMGCADRPKATFDQNDGRSRKNTDTLLRYVRKFDQVSADNIGLMLYGEAGNGKTFFAECVANALLEKGHFVWMTNIRDISGAMSGNYGEYRAYLLRKIRTVDLLILDDFGAERDSSYMNEQVYDIINERYKAEKPMMVTTNLDPGEMAKEPNITARRIYERVLEMCTPLRVEGGTRRSQNAAGKMKTLRSILDGD